MNKIKVRGRYYIQKVRGWWYLYGGEEPQLINSPTDRYKISPPKTHTEALARAKKMI